MVVSTTESYILHFLMPHKIWMCKLQKSNQEQRKTLNSLAYIYLFDPDMVQVNCISTEKSAQ